LIYWLSSLRPLSGGYQRLSKSPYCDAASAVSVCLPKSSAQVWRRAEAETEAADVRRRDKDHAGADWEQAPDGKSLMAIKLAAENNREGNMPRGFPQAQKPKDNTRSCCRKEVPRRISPTCH
jgi:hypothetical protein